MNTLPRYKYNYLSCRFTYILIFLLYSRLIASAQQANPVSLFELLHQLGERDGVYFTIESGGGSGFSIPQLDNGIGDVTIDTFKGKELSTALMTLFPNYTFEAEDTDRGRIIHLIDKHLTRPYILDRKVSVAFRGLYYDLLNSLDKDRKVALQLLFSASEPTGRSELADAVLSVHLSNAPIRSVLTISIPKVKWRILWRSILDTSGVAMIKCPASGRETYLAEAVLK